MIADIDLPLNVLKRGSITYYSINFIANLQRASDNQNFLTDNRSWLTKVYRFKFFNEFLRNEFKNEIKRIINNGLTGSSWYFKRFERLNVIVIPLTNETRFLTG